jgi:4-hydroxy-tetrahydrodipicolinate synthase
LLTIDHSGELDAGAVPAQEFRRVIGLPKSNALIAAAATPVGPDFRPDARLLIEWCRHLLAEGCDGIALFGTTGEGAEFSVEDRRLTLASLLAAGIAPSRLIVSVGALALPDIVALAAHATAQGVAGVLLMPPCMYRGGIGGDGIFRFYATVIDRVARDDFRLYLYHFPDISGIALTPPVIRRLSERYPRLIAGVKDSGGDLGFTEDLLRRFSHLRIFTGTETHIPAVLASGGAGTICGLANVIPGLLRLMSDGWTLPDRRRYLPMVQAVDNILSRGPFIPALKAVIADQTSEPAWRRVVPPMAELNLADEQRLLADFRQLAATLPRAPLAAAPAPANRPSVRATSPADS